MTQNRLVSSLLAAAVTAGLLAGCGSTPTPTEPGAPPVQSQEQVVNIYSARNYAVDDLLYDRFTAETGIKVNVVKGTAEELIERIKREGESTPADLFVTVDGGILNYAKQSGVLQPLKSATVDQNVPERLRDRDNQWIGLATRARVIVYAKDRVTPDQLSTYEDLADPKWKGKVLVRSSASLYNQSLLAAMIELGGEQQTEAWAKGLVANFGRSPEGGDRDQAKAIAAGLGDVAIMNTYYFGQMLTSKDGEEVKVAQQLGVFFPNQETTGTHINISGAGLTKYSKHQANAILFVEYLTSENAQSLLTQEGFEFPVNPKATKPELLKGWGDFKTQTVDFAKLGEHNKKALELMNKVGWK